MQAAYQARQQVMCANGKLRGALGMALNPEGRPQPAGIAW
jgi:hypothetical protein